jgi:NADH-quinone oxidoreductase subunit C
MSDSPQKVSVPDLAVEKLQKKFPHAIEVYHFRDEVTVYVPRERIVEVCRFLRDDADLKFNFLSDLTAVDWWGRTPRFEVVYHLYSLVHFQRLRLKVRVEEDDCSVPTVTGVWSTANWHEREVWDMFGIRFEGHPDLRRILTPEQVLDERIGEWKPFEGHPLRKDFDLDYEPPEFTQRKIARHYAKE